MAKIKVLSTPEEADARLILCADVRQCAKCKADTYWATPRQPKLGTCQACLPWMPMIWDLVAELGRRALRTLLEVFAGATVNVDSNPPMRPGRYGKPQLTLMRGYWIIDRRWEQEWMYLPPRDAGPCAGCNATIRRWGDSGRRLCRDCEVTR